MLGVNQGATGYNILAHSLASGAGINTIQATTSVVTPLVQSAGTLLLQSQGGLPVQFSSASGVVSANSDNTTTLGDATHRWVAGFFGTSGVFTPIIDSGTTGSLSLKTNNGTTVLTIANDLSVKPAGLLDLTTATSGQIGFPATQNPSAGVNVLDDYEEGTWTPSLGGSATYTIQSGNYTKIGNLVSFIGAITVNAIGTGSTTVISGLPFASLAVNFVFNARVVASSATAIVSSHGLNGGGVSTITIVSRTAANAADAVNAIFQNSTNVMVSGHYYTS
jgi:hypothetical protein